MSQIQEIPHKTLQSAVKDINALFKPKPQLRHIAAREVLMESIVTVIGAAVQAGDVRIDDLQRETIDTYNTIVSPGQEPAEPAEPVHVQEVAQEMAEEDNCPAFGTDFDPNAEECTACERAEECAQGTAAAKVVAVPAKPPKPPKPEIRVGPDVKPAGAPTKKSVILAMIARPEGASVQEMAEAISGYGYGTVEKNVHTVKLWMRKIGVPVEKRENRWYAVAPQ